jgi:hypothetical protein
MGLLLTARVQIDGVGHLGATLTFSPAGEK